MRLGEQTDAASFVPSFLEIQHYSLSIYPQVAIILRNVFGLHESWDQDNAMFSESTGSAHAPCRKIILKHRLIFEILYGIIVVAIIMIVLGK